MENNDTVELLKECNAGIKMGVSSIEEVLSKVKNEEFEALLEKCKEAHQFLGSETRDLLNKLGEEGKEPNAMAKGMSWIKTNVMLCVDECDNTVADLITDGCNMGVKSLNRYLNKYQAADEKAKDVTKRLIDLEHKLTIDIRKYL